MNAMYDRPMAAHGRISYRYRGQFGWIMIGATDDADALREARRSVTGDVSLDHLERWDGKRYAPVLPFKDPDPELVDKVRAGIEALKARNRGTPINQHDED